MCIVLFTTAHPDYALILIDNRDGYILRPTSRPHWWTHPATGQRVLSSRDLQRAEKGTWMGITKSGLFAVLTNYREADSLDASRPAQGVKSRGGMVTAWLGGGLGDSVRDGVRRLVRDGGVQAVGGFSMVCGKLRRKNAGLAVVSNRAAHADEVPLVASRRGETWGLSNTTFDAEARWPKVEAGTDLLRDAVQAAVETGSREDELVDRLFRLLDTDTLPATDPDMPFEQVARLLMHTIFVPPLGNEKQREAMREAQAKGPAGWAEDEDEDEGSLRSVEEMLLEQEQEQEQQQPGASAQASKPFETGLYGTQRQTVLLVDWRGRVKLVERALWDRNGHMIPRGRGDVVHEFQIESWDEDDAA
ncbi:hypothetical protein E4U41_003129 [Claviceps citrina]|nr:hypothetical protein E4U41_003129 [Claviceps citrina]